jgi:hypothetical protein
MHIYFIQQCDQFGNVKIGKANDVEARLKGLQTGSSSRLKILYAHHIGSESQAYAIEHKLHEMFSFCRKKGEYFSNNQLLRDLIASLASGTTMEISMEKVRKGCKKKENKKRSAFYSRFPRSKEVTPC